MNRFLKTNLLWLSLLGLAIFIVILSYLFRPNSPDYQSDLNQTLKMMQDETKQVTAQMLAGKQLIDIRSADLFEQGHPRLAINIPIRQLMTKESLKWIKELEKSGQGIVLCGTSELEATTPWLLLQQLGYKNILLFKGGISPNGDMTETSINASEASVVNAADLNTPTEATKPTVVTVQKKSAEAVIPVRKSSSAGGGC